MTTDFLKGYDIEYWLESCPQGYLMDTEYGHQPGEREPDVMLRDPVLRAEQLPLAPWAGGERRHFVRITPGILSGRRILKEEVAAS